MDPRDLRLMADQLDQECVELAKAGDIQEAVLRSLEANRLRRMAAEQEQVEPLTPVRSRGNKDPTVHAIDLTPDPLVSAAAAVGLTLRGLAEKIGVTHALLSAARRGRRSIKEPVARRVEKLTGFAATARNWPGGISEK